MFRPPCETPHACAPDGTAPDELRWVLPATILGSSLGFIDSSVVNVALPEIQQGLGSSFATVQWVMNGYMLTLAGLILLGGSMSDRFGRRHIFLIGLAGFAIASIACGFAPTAAWLIAARVVQGAAAAMVTPASLAIIGAAYSGKARGPAIGIWAAAGALTTALGPPLGGALVDGVSWRAIFYINVPVAALALWLGMKLPRDRASRAEPLDLRGAALATIALGLLSYGLIALGAGSRTAGAIGVAAAIPVAAWFVFTEQRSPAPMMPLSLFANHTFSGANALTVLLYAALSAALFMLPFMLIKGQGMSATAAGAGFLPFAVVMGVGSRWSGGLVERLGPKRPLTFGPALTAIGFVVLAVSARGSSYWTSVLPGLILVASGMTLAVAPLTTTVFDASPAEKSGTASGINNVAARAGGLIAVAALGLALGGSTPSGQALITAYRIVLFGAAVLAALGAVTAGVTIQARRSTASAA